MCGELQAANAAASTRHWKVPASLLENVKVGVGSATGPDGPVSIVVFGAVTSTDATALPTFSRPPLATFRPARIDRGQEDRPHLGRGERRVAGEDERRCARDVGRRHRRPVEVAVVARRREATRGT